MLVLLLAHLSVIEEKVEAQKLKKIKKQLNVKHGIRSASAQQGLGPTFSQRNTMRLCRHLFRSRRPLEDLKSHSQTAGYCQVVAEGTHDQHLRLA